MKQSYFKYQIKYSNYRTKTILLHHEIILQNKKSTQSFPELSIEKLNSL